MHEGKVHVKGRKPGFVSEWHYVTDGGGFNRLKLHAAIFKDETAARRMVEANRATAFEFRIVDLKGRVIATGV